MIPRWQRALWDEEEIRFISRELMNRYAAHPKWSLNDDLLYICERLHFDMVGTADEIDKLWEHVQEMKTMPDRVVAILQFMIGGDL